MSQGAIKMLGLIFFMVYVGNFSIYKIVGGVLLVIVILLVSLYRGQASLLYQPRVMPSMITPSQNPEGFRTPLEHGMPYEDVYLVTPDKLRLHAWFIRPNDAAVAKKRPTVLYFHANAGNMGLRLQHLASMYHQSNCNIFILSYRGYGESEGTPSEKGLLMDAECSLQWVLRCPFVDVDRLCVFGRSLGGAVAIAIASMHPDAFKGVIVENTFTNVGDMVDHLFPLLKPLKKYMLKLKWHSVERVADVTCPILFLSGMEDELVPPPLMRKLYLAAAVSTKKQVFFVANGMHNDTWKKGGQAYVAACTDFIHTPVSKLPLCTETSFQTAIDAARARPLLSGQETGMFGGDMPLPEADMSVPVGSLLPEQASK